MSARTETNFALQVLRGLAALLVVVVHLTERTEYAFADINPSVNPLPFGLGGGIGVDIFFIISGYIMAVISFGSYGKAGEAGNFLIKRIIRIFPLYFLATALLAVLKLAAGNKDGMEFPDFVMSVLFIPFAEGPILAPGWTLNFEMLFYVLFAVALLMPTRRLAICALTVVIGFVWASGKYGYLPSPFDYYGIDRILLFPLGLWLAEAQSVLGRSRRYTSSVLFMIFFAAVPLVVDIPNFLATTIYSLSFVGLCVFLADIRPVGGLNRGMIALGDASYSLYLIHPIVFKTVTTIWIWVFGPNHVWAFAATSLVAVVLVALASYRFVEVPITDWLRRRMLRRRPAPVATVPTTGSH